MFSDLIQISPQDLRKRSDQAIEDNINKKYANRVLQQVGLCVCFWDLVKISDGLISQGDGMVNVNVEFRLVIFRPFKGEIVQGVILDGTSSEGLRIGLDCFSDVWIPAANLFEVSKLEYRDNEQVWIWTTEEGTEFFYDKNEPVRFRVEAEVWNDPNPQKPTFDTGTTNGDVAVEKPATYTIIGSMQQAGLGPIHWWQEEDDEDDADGGAET